MGADAHLFADKIELAPGRRACDIDIATEAQSSSAATEVWLMIETTLLATSEKLWPLACRIFGAPCSSSAKEVAKKFSIPARIAGIQSWIPV